MHLFQELFQKFLSICWKNLLIEIILALGSSKMNDLEERCQFRLTEEEETIVLNSDEKDDAVLRKGGLSLIGKICTDRSISSDLI